MQTEEELKVLFSNRLQLLLKKYELKQNDLARIVGVSESTVGKWVLCKALPRMGVIQKLSDYFRVSMKYFLEPEATEAAIIRDELILSEHEKELIKKYRKLSPAGKEEVDHYIDFRLSAEAPRVEKDAEISSS